MAFCANCGNSIPDGAAFCNACGTPVSSAPASPVEPAEAAPVAPAETVTPANAETVAPAVAAAPAAGVPKFEKPASIKASGQYSANEAKPTNAQSASGKVDPSTLPEQYRPINMWAYFGIELLLGIPVVGFILTFVLAFAPTNQNLKNFVRSRFCFWIIGGIITGIIVALVLSGVFAVSNILESIF